MKKFKFTINGETFDVSVNEEGKNVAEVTVNGKPYTVEFEKEEAPANKPVIRKTTQKTNSSNTPSQANSAPAAKNAGSKKAIKSPLPGSVFKIPVSVGQTVKRGDLLVIIESMKMENNILADRDGSVKAIYVQIGQSVLQGDALVDLE